MKIELESTDIEQIAEKIMLRLTEKLNSGLPAYPADEDTVFTVETLAKYLQTTPKWVYNHLSDLSHFKVDGLLRFRKKVIDRFFEQNPSKCPVHRTTRPK